MEIGSARSGWRKLLRGFVVAGLVTGAFATGTLAWAAQHHLGYGLWAAAFGACFVGALGGFVFAAYGDERTRLAQFLTAGSALLGGAAVWDAASKEKSLLWKCVVEIADSCGLRGSAGAVAALLLGLAVVGFIGTYLVKSLVFNVEQARAEADLARLTRKRTLDDAARALVLSDPLSTSPPTEDAIAEAKDEYAERPDADAPAARKLVWAKAALVLGIGARFRKGGVPGIDADTVFGEARDMLRSVLDRQPSFVEARFHLARALIALGRWPDVVIELRRLAADRTASIAAWKMLGFACLYVDDATGAEDASRRYLYAATGHGHADAPQGLPETWESLVHDDAAALLDLACALGREPPAAILPHRRAEMFSALRAAVRLAPWVRDRLVTIRKPPHGEFPGWDAAPEWADLRPLDAPPSPASELGETDAPAPKG